MNSLNIIFGSCEFLPLWPTFHQRVFHVVSMSFPCTDGDWKASGHRMPGLEEAGWPGFNRSGGGGGVISV